MKVIERLSMVSRSRGIGLFALSSSSLINSSIHILSSLICSFICSINSLVSLFICFFTLFYLGKTNDNLLDIFLSTLSGSFFIDGRFLGYFLSFSF